MSRKDNDGVSDRSPNRSANESEAERRQRRQRRARVFGDVLPETTRDDRADGWAERETDPEHGDEWLRRQVPPHHGG
jgi:hypothetical protein